MYLSVQPTGFFGFFFLQYFICLYRGAHMLHSVLVEGREQFSGVGSLLPSWVREVVSLPEPACGQAAVLAAIAMVRLEI